MAIVQGKDIAVIGGGNSGVEAAIDLAGIVKHVTVLEFGENCRADDVLMDKLNSLDNVDVITSAATTEIVGDGKSVTGLKYTDRTTDEEKSLELSGVFVQIGLLPNTKWLEGSGIETSGARLWWTTTMPRTSQACSQLVTARLSRSSKS